MVLSNVTQERELHKEHKLAILIVFPIVFLIFGILFSLFENVFRVSECVAMSSKLGRHPFFQAFLEIVLFLGLGNDDERRAQHAVGDQVTLLQDIDDGVRFLFSVDHADCLMEVRVELLALRVDFREVRFLEGGNELLER